MPLSKERKAEYNRKYRESHAQKIPKWLTEQNRYLQAHLAYCPDYNPEHPNNHWEHCAYINPMLRAQKIPNLPNCPDGRYRPGVIPNFRPYSKEAQLVDNSNPSVNSG